MSYREMARFLSPYLHPEVTNHLADTRSWPFLLVECKVQGGLGSSSSPQNAYFPGFIRVPPGVAEKPRDSFFHSSYFNVNNGSERRTSARASVTRTHAHCENVRYVQRMLFTFKGLRLSS